MHNLLVVVPGGELAQAWACHHPGTIGQGEAEQTSIAGAIGLHIYNA
ncbi:MAG: hypothetical protein PVF70_01150 [Anaerolineales bacterium]|jgi:hypothetical protein